MQDKAQPVLFFPVEPGDDGMLAKVFLRRHGVSARLLAKGKRDGLLTVDGRLLRAVDRLRAGETVAFRLPADTLRVPPAAFPLSVVYEDDDLLVVDKPAGLAMHPSGGVQGVTLAAAVAGYFDRQGETRAFRPVGRLDRDTSGLVLAAKHAHAAHCLGGKVYKEYDALVLGTLEGDGVIDQPIRLREGCTVSREVGPGGQPSRTSYRVVQPGRDLSLLRVVTHTGRTHQIRVHMAFLGHPLAGDTLYGDDTRYMARQGLHCALLRFTQPLTGQEITVRSPLPADMEEALKKFGGFP